MSTSRRSSGSRNMATAGPSAAREDRRLSRQALESYLWGAVARTLSLAAVPEDELLFPHGVLFRNEEAAMRRALVERDLGGREFRWRMDEVVDMLDGVVAEGRADG